MNCFILSLHCLTKRGSGAQNCPCSSHFFKLRFEVAEPSSGAHEVTRDRAIESVLRKGVRVNGANFSFAGVSNSQLASKCFVFMRGSSDDVKRWYKQIAFGNAKLQNKPVPKQVKYRGLLFTGLLACVPLPEDTHVSVLSDVKHDNFTFTDGCGTMSLKLAQHVASEMRLKRCPSVFQVRYCGHGSICKGVLVVDHGISTQNALCFRPSMHKVSTQTGDSFSPMDNALRGHLGVVAFSRPGAVGKLSEQMATLLSADPDVSDALLSMQRDLLDTIQLAMTNASAAAFCCALANRGNTFLQLCRAAGQGKDSPPCFLRDLPSTLRGLVGGNNAARLSMPISRSRRCFGVAFPEKCAFLKPEQCLVSLTNTTLSDKAYWLEGSVLVSRSPSYSVGDLRILTAVRPPPKSTLLQLRDVIVFSTLGDRPDPDKMGGGDLDGDEYFICWEPLLVNTMKSKVTNPKPNTPQI
jgi:hypothetical protein